MVFMRIASVRTKVMAGFLASTIATPLHLSAQGAPPDFAGIVKQQLPAVVAIMTRQMADEQALATPDDLPFGELFRRYEDRRGLQQRPRTSLG